MFVLYAYLVGVLALIAGIGYWRYSSTRPIPVEGEHDGEGAVAGGRARGGMGRLNANLRRRQAGGADEMEEIDPNDPEFAGKLGKKKLQKLEKKQEKAAARQYMEEERQAKKEREEKREAAEKKKQKEKEEKEKKEQEEEEKRKAEIAKKEEEEFQKWKLSMSVENEGSGEAEAMQESQGLLNEFITYIKTHKVVVLENLAAEFGLRTQDVINRVTALEQMGYISGVLDDRGKFIYVTEEEMHAVAKYVKKKGRIAITDLALESRNLVNLDVEPPKPKEEATPVEAAA